MKNFIKYYYDLDMENYTEINNNINFVIDGAQYELTKYSGNINHLIYIYSILITYNVYCHEIILNKYDSIITKYNNDDYVLIKKHINDTGYVTLNTIYNYDVFIHSDKKLNWKALWEEKLDYYEYQISELGLKYNKLRESFGYYLGLCECAISLLNYANINNIRINISHKRINYKEEMVDFTNPLNITIDNITRDIASCIKSNAIYGNINIDYFIKYIDKINLTSDEYILFMARLLYPSYYFDVYDKIIQGIIPEETIETIIKKSDSFELLLKKLYTYIKKKSNIPVINWLQNSDYF